MAKNGKSTSAQSHDWPNSPVLPRDPDAHYGKGHKRAIVISGGGLAGLAFGAAYLRGLEEAGVDLRGADLVVGTSAGSILGTEIQSGHLKRFTAQIQLAAKTRLFERIRHDADPEPSAAHARALFDDNADGDIESLRRIGHAALAAKAPSQLSLVAQVGAFVRRISWPSPGLRTTACDAYTGERLVFSSQSKVPLLLALSASSSVPGLMSPVRIGNRRCVDGGMGSGVNADIAAGAEKALVIGLVHDPTQGKWTNRPNQWVDELSYLTNAGTEIESRVPAEDLGDPMDATALPLGLRLGAEQAAADAADLAGFWKA